ncbi:nitroreductase family deazaflavin-dependent oxidoreductase [Nakamurella flava]|uniref:Nitroreductase family deazaflavin-dependent oxidoreductase n=1 Tax=Nakamurella flava TaxID=2576308 RepID=A0A4U6QFG5_9ACTN|nr:nitroreductase family deazaflavin-dependent oxidoreductase [Nakamurella flava]TKV58841.1 nitroreductase family deazaflavin-dependent oxidoreductase [Nakamurella flava]
MPLTGEYEPSPSAWVREQVELYESSNGQQGNTLLDTGLPVVVFTMYGRKSGKLRKVPLMRAEHDGRYVLVASKGGAPENPEWDANLRADPRVSVQDGATIVDGRVRELEGAERQEWWDRAAAVFPTYNEYQAKTDRQIPVWLLEPAPID